MFTLSRCTNPDFEIQFGRRMNEVDKEIDQVTYNLVIFKLMLWAGAADGLHRDIQTAKRTADQTK